GALELAERRQTGNTHTGIRPLGDVTGRACWEREKGSGSRPGGEESPAGRNRRVGDGDPRVRCDGERVVSSAAWFEPETVDLTLSSDNEEVAYGSTAVETVPTMSATSQDAVLHVDAGSNVGASTAAVPAVAATVAASALIAARDGGVAEAPRCCGRKDVDGGASVQGGVGVDRRGTSPRQQQAAQEGPMLNASFPPEQGGGPRGAQLESQVRWGEAKAAADGGGATGVPRTACVEELALLHYGSPAGGGWRGVHSEGGVWTTLWALLCWDVLFMDVPEVFRSPFQTAPLDLDTDAFLPARREAVDARLQLIASGGAPDLIRAVWSRRVGTWCRGVNWERLTLDDLLQIAGCVGGLGLSVVCRLLCEDAGGWRGGMPDLLLWRPERGDAMVSEVKGPRDRLSDQQRAWLAALSAAGVRAEVLRVVEAPPPPPLPPPPRPCAECRPAEDGGTQQGTVTTSARSCTAGGKARRRRGAHVCGRRAMAVPIVCEGTEGVTGGCTTDGTGEGAVVAAASVAVEAHSGMEDDRVVINDDDDDGSGGGGEEDQQQLQ
ncbi:hypothetical protein Vretifemale_18441, partial [Volvox reticuliferus]